MPKTRVAKLLRQSRGILSLRQAEEYSETLGGHRINHETWRLYEAARIGRAREDPPRELLMAASKLPGAPTYEEFLAALVADREDRFRERYGCTSAEALEAISTPT